MSDIKETLLKTNWFTLYQISSRLFFFWKCRANLPNFSFRLLVKPEVSYIKYHQIFFWWQWQNKKNKNHSLHKSRVNSLFLTFLKYSEILGKIISLLQMNISWLTKCILFWETLTDLQEWWLHSFGFCYFSSPLHLYVSPPCDRTAIFFPLS